MNRILVTASTGNIGSEIIKNLVSLNVGFSAGVNSDQTGKNEVHVDFNDVDNLRKAFDGFETVFLLFPMHPKMVDWARNAVSAAKDANVKRLVRSSGAGANSASPFLMAKTQGQIDDIIRHSGIPYTLCMPASFMQNFVNFFAQDIKNGRVYQPVGNGKMGWVDVRDIAAVNAQVLISPERYVNQALTITGGENLSYAEALQIISDKIQKPVEFVDIPAETAIAAMREYKIPQFTIDMLGSLNEIIKAGYAEGTTTTVRDVTGKEPISFSKFVDDYQSAWQ